MSSLYEPIATVKVKGISRESWTLTVPCWLMGSAVADSSGMKCLPIYWISGKLQAYFSLVLWFFIIVTLIWISCFTLISPETLSIKTKKNGLSENRSEFEPERKSSNTKTATQLLPLNPDAEKIIKSTMRRLEDRVEKRQSLKSFYQTRLNQTKNWATGNHPVYVSHGINDGGLGNWLFMVASLYGVARSNDRIPSLFQSYWAENYFDDFSLPKINKSHLLGSLEKSAQVNATVADIGAGKYAYWMSDINWSMGQQNVILSGYLQSWRYFDRFREEIRSLFVFGKKIFNYALGAVWSELRKFYFGGTTVEDLQRSPRLVGIHVRRGDITTASQRRHGHLPAPREYLRRAVTHFRRKYPAALFLVITNDDEYCRDVFRGRSFMFLEQHHEAVDLAILSLMDDLILSVGSYGWWGAYLSDAQEVLYYRDWPQKGSDMARAFNAAEYFLPSWTPMA